MCLPTGATGVEATPVAQDRLYRALGVPKTADQDTIKKAYRKLARELHPDKNPDDPGAEARFKEVNSAYEVLGDADKRKMYDRFGDAATKPGFDAKQAQQWQQWQQGAPGGGYVDLESMLGSFFGQQQARRPRRGRDVRATATLAFRVAALGGQLDLTQSDGTRLKVRVPKGARHGDTIRLRGKGQGFPGAPPGDLLLELRVERDPTFERAGENLVVTVDCTVPVLLRGGSIEVPTLTGTAKMKIPPCSQPGQKLRLRGKGVTRGKTTGDLVVRLGVVLPQLDPDQLDDHADLIDALEALYAPAQEPAA